MTSKVCHIVISRIITTTLDVIYILERNNEKTKIYRQNWFYTIATY